MLLFDGDVDGRTITARLGDREADVGCHPKKSEQKREVDSLSVLKRWLMTPSFTKGSKTVVWKGLIDGNL